MTSGPRRPIEFNHPTLGPDVLAAMGRSLRVVYARTVEQPVPDQFLAILRRLEGPPLMVAAGSASGDGMTGHGASAHL